MFYYWWIVALVVVVVAIIARAPRPKREEPKKVPAPAWWRDIVFVDANNVRGALKFEMDIVEVCAACCRAAAVFGVARIVVCVDHGPFPCAIECGGIAVAFAGKKSGKYETADDMIVSACGRAAKLGARVAVVTSDRELTRRCRFACHRFSPASFLRSQDFGDWLDRVDAFRPLDDRFHAFGAVKNDWVAETPRLLKKKRGGKAVAEGTPSRVDQAAGLHARLVAWSKKERSSEKDDESPFRDFLRRHPWGKR